MLPTDVLNTLRALSLNERPLITPLPDKNPGSKGAFEIGQKVQGTIQAQVSPGVFKVRVLEQTLHMQLPADFRSGDVVELQVMSLQPRLTFSLSASSNPLSTPEQLSSTSRLLSSLSQQMPEKAAIHVAQSEPLLATASGLPNTTELADKLHDSLSKSGLFYEAHQAQWIAGARSTAQLLQEPQNQLADTAKTALGNLNPAGSHAAAQSENGASSIPGPLQPLVQQQLNALETRQVLWQGPVWANQQMDWEIHEETPRQSAPGYEETGGQWATQIRLDLPHLGEVAAMLRFNSHGLSITLDASGEQTRALFGAASSQLTAALSERGIAVSSTLVVTHGKP
ncbi:MAG: flagellar hook-length control protein FliK [Gallionellaceae bacterium]|nr:MAG: flagellar hook-length control protein FliK [Gallionellaceae bacterium]